MKIKIVLLLLLAGMLFAENIKQVKIFVNDKNDVAKLLQAGIIDESFIFERNNSVTTFLNEVQFERLRISGFNHEILIDDWKTHYSKREKPNRAELNRLLNESKQKYNVTGFNFGSMGGFLTLDEVYAKLDEMHSSYPNLISEKIEIGQSIQGRKIYAVKISDNHAVDEDEPEVFYNALIHSREPQGMMGLIYYMFYLLENYGINDEATYLINNREIFFVPVFNVDGYEYNRTTDPNGGGYWRKNRRQNSDGSYGVDLNRNWGFEWGYDDIGSSNIPSETTYRGTAPFSEPENQVIRDFVISRNFKTALNYHTYSNLLIIPYGYENIETPDSLIFREYAAEMTKFNNYSWGTSSNLLYAVNGSTDDWMYGEQILKEKIISMTPEVGNGSDGFWPLENRIIPLAQENLYPNLFIAWVAGGYPNLVSPNFSQQYFNPGERFSINPVIKNVGLEKLENFQISISTLSDALDVEVSTKNIPLLESRKELTLENGFELYLNENAQLDEKVKFVINFSKDGIELRADTISIRIGTPRLVFEDVVLNENDIWDFYSSSSTNWKRTSTQYFSAPFSLTDSENSTYENNVISRITTKNSISLAGTNNPLLIFRSKWNIETGWDCGRVQVSSNNGSTWITLGGKYSSDASGDGTQTPLGSPVYHGIKSTWIEEEIDLSQFEGSNIKLRFELQSDDYIEVDGWYLDDIRIVYFQIVPVELTSFWGELLERKIKLNWETATELNNNGFEIYKSVDKLNWNLIGFKEGKGTIASQSYYSFIDENPINGKNYYRLNQIDYDGTVNHLKIIEIENQKSFEFSLEQNYPNPFNPITSIDFTVPGNEFVSLKVYDVLGNEIATLVNEPKQSGSYKVNFDASNIPSGVYLYRFQSGNFNSTKKLILLK